MATQLGIGLSPPVERWFSQTFAGPTDPQRQGWPAIARGDDVLISAPTGSGKTLTAFLMVLDRLVRRALDGRLEDAVDTVYVSPLRALSHDIHRNLTAPLEGIRAAAAELGIDLPPIRCAVRTGDTPQAERAAMLRHPPHIVVTTPESLYLMLTAPRARELLRSARTVIVDEIHAVVRDKRGAHLALTLERLEDAAHERPARVGLSATQRPIELLARWLVGARRSRADGSPECTVVDLGHQRDLDLAVEAAAQDDLQAVAPNEHFDDVLGRIANWVCGHTTTLVFVNTRRLAERVAHQLGEKVTEMLGGGRRPELPSFEQHVAAHHGSLARERRLMVEERLKSGELRALVATASLELGIDIGHVDLVVQIGSPRSIATFLQRVGRSGHALGKVPKGRLLPTTRDELVECAALVRAVRFGRLDGVQPPRAPLDILSQQLVAHCASLVAASPHEGDADEGDRRTGAVPEDALFDLVRGAAVYAELGREDFDAVLEMLAAGFETPKGRRGQHLFRNRVAGTVRARRGARLAAITSGGAIPETGDYRVVLDPGETFLGTVNEDWAIESMAGDVFLLGSHSWRIRRIESGVVRVEDAKGAPPSIPFWLGEAPARTRELSEEVSRLRREIVDRIESDGPEEAARWLAAEALVSADAAEQIVRYVHAQKIAAGLVPTREDLLVERFFDDSGGMQLVIHAPYAARVNRAFGLALRKRFCKSFDQELQASATDDGIVLSLGSPQTFPLENLRHFLNVKTVREVLEQAMLGSPLFGIRWRWNASRALALLRAHGGKAVPFNIQRMQAEDLLAAAFPQQAACQENVSYPIDIPEHPLVRQTVHDCLHEAADLGGLERLLADLDSGAVRMHFLDTVEPTPFSHALLNARPYAFLDDAPLEERRTRAVSLRHTLPDAPQPLAQLDPEVIARVRAEAAWDPRDDDELHELLVDLVAAPEREVPDAAGLVSEGRALRIAPAGVRLLVAAERLAEVRALWPGLEIHGSLARAGGGEGAPSREDALETCIRGHLAFTGPAGAGALAARIGLEAADVEQAFIGLEGRGIALRGRFDPDIGEAQACDRSLLARIHRGTLDRLRQQIEPVSATAFLRFLARWQRMHPEVRVAGERGLRDVLAQLSGWSAPIGAWEREMLPARVQAYRPRWLDALCLSGDVAWGRLHPGEAGSSTPTRSTPIALFLRADEPALLRELGRLDPAARGELRPPAQAILGLLETRGALFASELRTMARVLGAELEEGLRELVAQGLVSSDGFGPLRRLLASAAARAPRRAPQVFERLSRAAAPEPPGRWHVLREPEPRPDLHTLAEAEADRCLRRYGVVFRDLLARESLSTGWKEVHRALRRLESRGVVRGGRFVTGFIGEQFALPEAVPALRREREGAPDAPLIRLGTADPLNLVGILTPGGRVPAGSKTELALRNGEFLVGSDAGVGAPGAPRASVA